MATCRKREPGVQTMAALDWSQCPAVESIPGKVSGAWVFKGTRLPVATVFENLEDLSIDEVIEQFDVTREQVMAVLDFVAESLRADARMTEAGLRMRRGLVLSPQSFGHRVRNSIYVGRIESRDYGVSTRGDFEPLIDEATFYRVQAVHAVRCWLTASKKFRRSSLV